MTERIKALGRQASKLALEEYYARQKTEFVGDVIYSDIYDQKLAELIIKECMEWCDAYATIDGTAQQVKDAIEKDFGINQ
jgi:hypothetical protein